MAIDGSLPPWLERNVAPRESFDPTPWLQARFQREVQKQKLPLELQQMELANKANRLSIQHQGMMNDQFNLELNTYEKELPALQEWMEKSQTNPGLAPPPVLSQKGKTLIVDRQKINSETALGMAYKQRMATQNKIIADIIEAGGTVGDPGPDGLYDLEDLGQRKEAALDKKNQREIDREIKKGTAQANARSQLAVAEQQAIAEARAKFNPDVMNAQRLAELRSDLRDSETRTAERSFDLPMIGYAREMGGDTFDANSEAKKQIELRDMIDALERTTARGRTASGYVPDVAEKQALAIQRAWNELEDARAGGDPKEIDQAQRFYGWLTERMDAQHRDPIQMRELDVITSRLKSLNATIAKNGGVFPEQITERDQLEKKLRDYYRNSPGSMRGSPEQPAGTNAPPTTYRKRVYKDGGFTN